MRVVDELSSKFTYLPKREGKEKEETCMEPLVWT